MKITKNFSFWEFGPKGCPHSWTPDNEYQKMLVEDLAFNLQKLHDVANKISKVSITISSGIRTLADYYRLQGVGYHPSQTSDHFFGALIPIPKDSRHHNKFGDTYGFSVGAADCVIRGMDTTAFAKMAMEEFRRGSVKFGQVIYEKNGKVEWVHLSNSYENYFSTKIVTWLNKKPFLKSVDGGKTYTVEAV